MSKTICIITGRGEERGKAQGLKNIRLMLVSNHNYFFIFFIPRSLIRWHHFKLEKVEEEEDGDTDGGGRN